MKEKIFKLIKEMKEDEEEFLKMEDISGRCNRRADQEYWLGKWHEVNKYRRELEEILESELQDE